MIKYLLFKPTVQCEHCGFIGKSKTKQSEWWGVFWWFVYLPVTFFYTIFRNTRAVCPKCGSEKLLVVDSQGQENWLKQRIFINKLMLMLMVWLSGALFLVAFGWYFYVVIFGMKYFGVK